MPFDDDAADDVTDFGPPPHPDDRLWRHPSELVTPRATVPRAAPHRWPWGLVAGAGTVGVMLVGIGAFVVGLRDRVIAEHEPASAAINPLGNDAVQPFGNFNGIGGPSVVVRAKKVAPSIVSVEGVGTGSGVVVSDDGVVITSADLVGSLSEVQVTFEDGSMAFATNLGADPTTRVAVLDVPDERLDSARLKAPDATTMGKVVVLAGKGGDGQLRTALGTLESRQPAQSLGEVPSSMLQIDTDDPDLAADFQGAAVLDASGSVLGLATWSDDERFYIAPIDVARTVAADLLTVGASVSD